MTASIPHYLLMSEACTAASSGEDDSSGAPGQWRFVLEAADGQALLEVDEEESETDQERLDLIAVVRGLEALDQPSRVTLVTGSSYVQHGFRYGLDEWRQNAWQWERFGEMAPVRNADLWRRVDRALRYHRVDCRVWRFDKGHVGAEGSSPAHQTVPSVLAAAPSVSASSPPAPHFERNRVRSRQGLRESDARGERPGASSARMEALASERLADPIATTMRHARPGRAKARRLARTPSFLANARENVVETVNQGWRSCCRWLANALRTDET